MTFTASTVMVIMIDDMMYGNRYNAYIQNNQQYYQQNIQSHYHYYNSYDQYNDVIQKIILTTLSNNLTDTCHH